MSAEPASPWPVAVVRARARNWVRRLVVAGAAVVVGSWALVGDPVEVRVVPRREGLALGRWLDSRDRPVHWLLDEGRPAVPLSPDLDPVDLEAFAYCVGLPVVDLDGAPRARR